MSSTSAQPARAEAAGHENAQLRRELARARAQNRALRSGSGVLTPKGAERGDREAWIRVMLADSHSRNP